MRVWKVQKIERRELERLAVVVDAYGGASSFAEQVPGGNRRMVLFWLDGEKLPEPKRAACVNELARAKALPAVFTVVKETPPPVKPGERSHRSWVFRNREFGVLVRAFGDIFLFADAAAVSVKTAYRWAARANEPRSYHALRVNELARARNLAEPFILHEQHRFRGRGPLAALVRALGGIDALAREADVSETSVRRWLNGKAPWLDVACRVNNLAQARKLAAPFNLGACRRPRAG